MTPEVMLRRRICCDNAPQSGLTARMSEGLLLADRKRVEPMAARVAPERVQAGRGVWLKCTGDIPAARRVVTV